MLALIGALIWGALLVLLFLCVWRREGQSVAFPAFSLAIESISHEANYLHYRVGEKMTEFYAATGRGSKFFRTSMITTIPKEIGEDEASKIAADLALGLSKLGYEYAIYRDGAVLAHS